MEVFAVCYDTVKNVIVGSVFSCSTSTDLSHAGS